MRESGPPSTRREFLTNAASWGANGLGLAYFVNMAKEGVEVVTDGWEHEDIKAHLDPAPWGGKCTIFYDNHFVQEPRDLAVDLITLEGIKFHREPGAEEEAEELKTSSERKNFTGPDRFAVDVPMYRPARIVGTMLSGAEVAALYVFGKKIKSPLLKAVAFSLAVGGISSPVISLVSQVTGHSRGFSSSVTKINNSLITTPNELFVFKLRNLIAAEKNYFLAQAHGNSAHLGTIWGAAHGALETETLKSSEERIRSLALIKPLMPYFMPMNDPYLWSCLRVEVETHEIFDAVEVPSLKALFAEN